MRLSSAVLVCLASSFDIALAPEPALAAKAIIRRGFIAGDAPALPCTIQVDFTARAHATIAAGPANSLAGPDLDAFERIRTYVIETLDVDEAEAWGWGASGEFTLCLTIHDRQAAPTILNDLMKLAPETASGTAGAVSVRRGAKWR